ncbi:hypothetical protein GCM10010984_30680 [Chishuiella changwenlii]|nr:hypothetical protein GCM10010984_30680 [Chishuiella changwenlii]
MFFFYLYFFYRDSNIISQNNFVTTKIIEKFCSGGKGRSSIKVIYNQSIYKINYGRNECAEYNVGETLNVYYDNKNDILINPGSAKHSLCILIVVSIILLFLLIPWKKILS